MAAAAVPYCVVTDPLTAGTLVQCIDAGGINGFEPENRGNLRGSDGVLKQTDVKGWIRKGIVRYNPLGTMTWSGGTCTIDSTIVFYPGQTTAGGPIVLGAKPSETTEGYQTIDVDVEALIDATFTHTW